jgi:hypothetical protein
MYGFEMTSHRSMLGNGSTPRKLGKGSSGKNLYTTTLEDGIN